LLSGKRGELWEEGQVVVVITDGRGVVADLRDVRDVLGAWSQYSFRGQDHRADPNTECAYHRTSLFS
jgi:hypothetical protein